MHDLVYEKVITVMQEIFGDRIVNHEHQPKIFEYQVKLAKWVAEKQWTDTEPSSTTKQ